ncbi:hypothetical protein SELMODRAFT_426228 [Selaginella moellendorffii]|uniref:Uncharacterized protein ALF4-2 n=1 Tax=Selaginella moellendorffii TaxID=88036 RepID=D8SVR7_SELML|nr:hypothetical protein SELMODRAFT_426228 [Selaginella moellendorffii]
MALVERLREAGDRCCQYEDDAIGDFKRVLESAVLDGAQESTGEWEGVCQRLLLDVKAMLDPSTEKGRMLLEAVGWDLPGAILNYARVSEACREVSLDLIVLLAESCSPREILATLLEALHISIKLEALDLCLLLLEGLSSVLPRIQRRRAEFANETVDVLLPVAVVSQYLDDDEVLRLQILHKLLQLCQVLQEMFAVEKADDQKEMLRGILSYFALVLMTAVVSADTSDTSNSVSQLLEILKSCGLTVPKLLDRSVISSYTAVQHKEDAHLLYDSEADCGAALAGAASLLLKDKTEPLCTPLEALDVSTWLFGFVLERNGSWKLAEKGLKFIQSVLAVKGDACFTEDDHVTTATKICSLLKILHDVVIRSPYPSLRNSAYDVLLKVLRRTSADARFLCLVSLVGDGCHSAVVSLLLTFAKDEVDSAWRSEGRELNPFVSERVLELVEKVLRPKEGAPPNLPQNLDAVVGALNLYRFLLLREKSGGTNYTGILSRAELVKAKSQWLEPLRAAISAIPPDDPEIALHVDALQMTRSRCLELVEAELAQP